MFGIEMLGLILDPGSPDTIPWRVQVAVDRARRELTELESRILLLCGRLQSSASHSVVDEAMDAEASLLVAALDSLEVCGFLRVDDGVFRVSSLMADSAAKTLRANIARMDALRAARFLALHWTIARPLAEFYSCLSLYISAGHEGDAAELLDRFAGAVMRRETAHGLSFELAKLKRESKSADLIAVLDTILDRIAKGSKSSATLLRGGERKRRVQSLPAVSDTCVEVEYTFSSDASFVSALSAARDPSASPQRRMSDAAMALVIASNTGDTAGLSAAFQAVNAVRHAPDINLFDSCRADLIYFASIGDMPRAVDCAGELTEQSRVIQDVQMACKGLRNAAEILATTGFTGRAQSLLHESRALAAKLEYSKQVAWADIRLADLALECMDTDSAREYLTSASRIVEANTLGEPLLLVDLGVQKCWEALLRGDTVAASKAARVVQRRMQKAYSGPGAVAWTLASIKLATDSCSSVSEKSRVFESLRASIGSRPYYPNEPISLAALLLASKNTSSHATISNFVESQFPRIESVGRAIWPFLRSNLA